MRWLILLLFLPVFGFGQWPVKNINVDGSNVVTKDVDGNVVIGRNLTVNDTILTPNHGNSSLWQLDNNVNNELQDISGSGLSGTTLTIGIENGVNENVDLSPLQDGTGTDDQTLSIDSTSRVFDISIENGNTVSFQDTYIDSDADVTNEYNTSLGLTGNILELTDPGGTLTQDLSSLQGTDDQILSIDSTNRVFDISIEDGNTVSFQDTYQDGDTDATNEYNTSLGLTGNTLELTDNGSTLQQDLSGLSFDDYSNWNLTADGSGNSITSGYTVNFLGGSNVTINKTTNTNSLDLTFNASSTYTWDWDGNTIQNGKEAKISNKEVMINNGNGITKSTYEYPNRGDGNWATLLRLDSIYNYTDSDYNRIPVIDTADNWKWKVTNAANFSGGSGGEAVMREDVRDTTKSETPDNTIKQLLIQDTIFATEVKQGYVMNMHVSGFADVGSTNVDMYFEYSDDGGSTWTITDVSYGHIVWASNYIGGFSSNLEFTVFNVSSQGEIGFHWYSRIGEGIKNNAWTCTNIDFTKDIIFRIAWHTDDYTVSEFELFNGWTEHTK